MNARAIWRHFILASAILLFGPAIATAQTSTGEINGSVVDQSGAAIANARVSLIGPAQGPARRARLNHQSGWALYLHQRFNEGTYAIHVQAPGFKNLVQEGITIQVNQIISVAYKLSIGNVEEKVEVQAEGEALQAPSAGLGTVIDTVAANDLPLNGHNFTQLLTLTPGVTPVQNEQGANAGSSYQQDVTIPRNSDFPPQRQWTVESLQSLLP